MPTDCLPATSAFLSLFRQYSTTQETALYRYVAMHDFETEQVLCSPLLNSINTMTALLPRLSTSLSLALLWDTN